VPVVYNLAAENGLTIKHQNGLLTTRNEWTIDESNSLKIFERTGEITEIHVHIHPSILK
jgi:hypothetical protein